MFQPKIKPIITIIDHCNYEEFLKCKKRTSVIKQSSSISKINWCTWKGEPSSRRNNKTKQLGFLNFLFQTKKVTEALGLNGTNSGIVGVFVTTTLTFSSYFKAGRT